MIPRRNESIHIPNVPNPPPRPPVRPPPLKPPPPRPLGARPAPKPLVAGWPPNSDVFALAVAGWLKLNADAGAAELVAVAPKPNDGAFAAGVAPKPTKIKQIDWKNWICSFAWQSRTCWTESRRWCCCSKGWLCGWRGSEWCRRRCTRLSKWKISKCSWKSISEYSKLLRCII